MSEEEREEGMKPWEQHSAVISIPRFDYNAPSSLLDHSHSGFLVTCTIKREKSATKEAMPILEKVVLKDLYQFCILSCHLTFLRAEFNSLLVRMGYCEEALHSVLQTAFSHVVFILLLLLDDKIPHGYVGSFSSCSSESLESSDANATTKRRKICTEEIDEECVNSAENKTASNNCGEDGDAGVSSANRDAIVENGHVLSLVKLTRSGLLLFVFPRNNSVDTVDVVSQIIRSLQSGSVKPPLKAPWKFGEMAIGAICKNKEGASSESSYKSLLLECGPFGLKGILKFAVGYNRRGIEETEMKIPKEYSKRLLSGGLKSPELSVLVELLPLSRVPNGSMVVAVSVLPQNLITTKHVSALRHCFLTPKWGIERVSSSCISRNCLHSMTSGFLLDFQKEMLMQNGTAKLIMGGMISSMR
ncbi:hypothetical protein CK203_053264 [Vitis vinifera]|uniref:THUMP domain-containing protein n=1 Tax=Vitis vinifera TaxID=29760 RepID=A0A438GQ39_VITVI|nr:hypothetical protein CK203_053264 [Vitis vinifera]